MFKFLLTCFQSGDDSEATSRLKSVTPGVNNNNSSHERISNENGEIIDYKKVLLIYILVVMRL